MGAFDIPRKIVSIAESNPEVGAKLLDATIGVVAGKEMATAIRAGAEISRGIPPLRPDGFLENGIHLTTWSEMIDRFGFNQHRINLSRGMLHAAHDLRETQKVEASLLGGSYFSNKEFPRDFDMTYEAADRKHLIDIYDGFPLLENRRLIKLAYGGDVLPNLKEIFQEDRTGKTKGILQLDLHSLPPRPDPVSPAVNAMRFHHSILFEYDPRLALAVDRVRTLLGFGRNA